MTLVAYRVCKSRYPAFSGVGAAMVGGRWNSPGRELIYCARSYAGALLEILVHANLGRLPGAHQCIVVEVPDEVAVETAEPADVPGWDAEGQRESRAFGDRWLAEGRTAVLVVPSVVARPYEWNVLVNPLHPDVARLRVGAPEPVHWDARLFGTRGEG